MDTRTVNIRLSPDMYDLLAAMAIDQDTSISTLITNALRRLVADGDLGDDARRLVPDPNMKRITGRPMSMG